MKSSLINAVIEHDALAAAITGKSSHAVIYPNILGVLKHASILDTFINLS